ncbi:MAG: transcription antitermination factor NusB [Lachnospiraceae bacterium]|uniref:Transcription antitermination protein NusB n=1 Tax=Candidatus Weimeria bifida TaxID=2599074 RepID=A0A6N7J346_9FIRM|nr:transcription antitermination factor NusB [Candidatus Weimeria bifida]RRF96180.1 MAG: transcription antitermination factor NusB [Lachnospiraceae bacterium]
MNKYRLRDETFKRLFMSQFYSDESYAEVVKANDELETLVPEAEISPYIEPELGNGLSEDDMKQLNDRVDSIRAHIPELDQILDANITGWKLNRIAKVDLTILRLACYELYYDDSIPPKVSVNEAVELAKKYGSEKSGSFVNGVLSHVIRSLDARSSEDRTSENGSNE